MKKKIIIASATVLFAVATVFNMNLLQGNSVGDVSLDAIAVMAQAQGEPTGNGNNNSNMGGLFNYPNLSGSPQFCTLYAKVDMSGRIVSTSEAPMGQVEGGFSVTTVTGVKERCPRKGDGCTVYSCTQTN